MPANDDSRREQRKRDDGQEKDESRANPGRPLKAVEMGHHAERGDGFGRGLPETHDVGEELVTGG